MKKLGSILCLSLAVLLMSANLCFGAGLTLVKSFPEEGKSNLNPQNIAVKLVFSEKISDPVAIAANTNNFTITDNKGKAIKFEPLYNENKYPNEVWLQISQTLDQNTEYKVIVSEGMQSAAGNVLDKSIVLNFSTRNTEADSKGYMVLMVIMVGGMMAFTVIDTRRKLRKETAQKGDGAQKVNPYKEARRTGKSVEEVVARAEKEKAQAERRKAKVARRDIQTGEKNDALRPGVKKVRTPKPISKMGYKTPQSFIDGRIAREEAKAREKQRNKQRPQQRSKGSKQQQRKKK